MIQNFNALKSRVTCRSLVAALCGIAMMTVSVSADEIRSGGFNYGGITVEAVENNRVIYTNQSGAEVELPLARVEWIKLDRLPEFGKGEEARMANNLEQAVRDYRAAAEKAQTDWARRLSQWRLYQVASKANKPVIALQAYLAMMQLDADDAMAGPPPVALVTKLTENQRTRLIDNARRVFRRADADKRLKIQELLDAAIALQKGEAVKVETPKTGPSRGGDQQVEFGEALTKQGLILYSKAQLPGVTELISAGDFAEASNKAYAALTSGSASGGVPMKLYLLGMAQLGIAEASQKPEDYMDAAISFMRVPIHYERHSYRVPCLVEAAYCHLQFDRADIASNLLDQAEEELDETEYPEYTKRIDALREEIQKQTGGS